MPPFVIAYIKYKAPGGKCGGIVANMSIICLKMLK